MGFNQTRPFWQYPLVSGIDPEALVILHDPIIGDVNVKVSSLLATLATILPALPGFSFVDVGGTGKQCIAQMRYTGNVNGDDQWQMEVTSI